MNVVDRARKVRLELLAMVETIEDVRSLSMSSEYLGYFRNASIELRKQVKEFAGVYPAWDVLNMCLNASNWRSEDYDVLIGVTNKFMQNNRKRMMRGQNGGRN